jgi:aminoglycoside N3'-acetyltransferase
VRAHYTRSDAELALREAGLESGDIVFVTTSLGMLGPAEGVESSDDLNRLHFEALRAVLGRGGTILVPAYSYTIGRSTASEPAVFDPAAAPAEIGPFPEFFRKQPGVVRSLDPMISVAGLGPAAERLFGNLPPTSYGPGCLFARLTETAAKCCSIGLGPNWMPFIHYADWLCHAPFRYDKLFRGLIKRGGELVETAWVYSVPLLQDAAYSTGHVIGKMAVEAGIWKFAALGRARVYAAGYRDYFDFTVEKLTENAWLTAAGPPADPLLLEEARVPRREYPAQLRESATLEELFLKLAQISRPDVSDSVDFALDRLAGFRPVKVRRFRSGENHFSWIIPERWRVRKAELRTAAKGLLWSLEDGEDRVYAYCLSAKKTVDKTLLRKHVRFDESGAAKRLYVSTVNNRDWGFCCSREEWENLPEDDYQVSIDADFSLGEMKIGELTVEGRSSGTLLLLAYLNGPAFVSDLLGAYTAIRVADALSAGESCPALTCRILLLPGPAGFAAWMNTAQEASSRITAAVELGVVRGSALLPLRRSAVHREHQFVQALESGLEKEFKTTVAERPDSETYCLRTGGNPLAAHALPPHDFPIVSVGDVLTCQDFSGSGGPAGESLGSECFGEARRVGDCIARLLQAGA